MDWTFVLFQFCWSGLFKRGYPRRKKRRLIKSKDPITKEDKSFYSPCSVTADGRWFDNGGFPINPPSKVEDEEQKEEVGFARRELTEEEKAEQLKWKQRAESEMLSKLK